MSALRTKFVPMKKLSATMKKRHPKQTMDMVKSVQAHKVNAVNKATPGPKDEWVTEAVMGDMVSRVHPDRPDKP